ncbi:Rrf2 family protein [Rubrobacter radiotolerans]|uniref:Rrf2 family protein n=1 Tax=Rubrobacter radiotolerans TaxID=42256 RepID=A0A023X0I1_RUBRA|nr:Rrf2 family protein [Rubrobacter radiotolerans]SMC03390.1 transcriptional regulator, BadM/Rrf2 family [Rubrobacter radiotolerans DSM 5868]
MVGLKLELSSEGRYALRALVYLAGEEELTTADRISSGAGVPRRLLSRVMAKLVRAGLVESREGRRGGARLALPPGSITLRDAVEAVEGPFEVTHCILEQRACGTAGPCALHHAWIQGQQAILSYLETRSLADFVSETASNAKTPQS